jgi:pyrroloquinoline quinone biosynthesis protein B
MFAPAPRRRFVCASSVLVLVLVASCITWANNVGQPPRDSAAPAQEDSSVNGAAPAPFIVVVGIAQDGGYPQAGCQGPCCRRAWDDPTLRRWVTSLAIIDPATSQRWLVECTPDFREQLHWLDTEIPRGVEEGRSRTPIDGIFLTHAHIGHYAGLVHLGRETIGAHRVPTYVMPRMRQMLETNAPWSQLVQLEQIELVDLAADTRIEINERLAVTPLLVPHRDEFSETVAFVISGPTRRVLFLPDIDKWQRWERHIEEVLATVDVAYLDGTFFGAGELPGRNMDEIPHPFVAESIDRFGALPADLRGKIRFIHLNHTNPALQEDSPASEQIRRAGLNIAAQGERVEL